jgi:hypothetical protein
MLKKVSKIAILVTIVSSAVSISPLTNWRVWDISEVLGADKDAGPLMNAGQKHWIGSDNYVVYNFDKRPQMGAVIVKIQVFTKDGKQDSTLDITGRADMPSMRGAHGTGDRPFQLNKKGDYVLPVNVVMPGEWEVVLNFLKDNKPVYTGIVRFNV